MAERDLARMLATLSVRERPGRFAFVATPRPDPRLAALAHAIVREDEGVTYVVDADEAQVADDRDPGGDARPPFRAAWLTLEVQSALDAVGLTAAVAGVLAAAGIPCNVIAGHFHDHLLVAAAQRDEALAALASLRRHRDGG